MGRPKIKQAAPPPPAPFIPQAPIFGRSEVEKAERKMRDPRRVGRRATIKTGRGLLGANVTKQKLGSGDTSSGS